MSKTEQSEMDGCPACGSGVEKLTAICRNCGFNLNKGAASSEEILRAKEVLNLIQNPVRLSEFKRRYPYLNQGKFDTDYVRIIDHTMKMDKSKLTHLILASFPRQWAIKKVGLFRRFLTLFIDWPLLMVLFLGGLAVFIGSATEPGLLSFESGGKAVFAWVWFFISYFFYFAGAEHTFGATIGGLLLGVRVVNKFGNKQSFKTLLLRNAYKLIPLIGPFALAPYVKPDHEVVKY